MRSNKPAIFAANFAALYATHQWADHVWQREGDAIIKQDEGTAGARACGIHVGTVVAATATASYAVNKALKTGASTRGWLAAMAINGASHYLADRGMEKGRPFRPVLRMSDSTGWVDTAGVVRHEGKGTDLRGPGTAAYAIDQAWHTLWLAIAAFVIAVCSRP